MSTSTPLCVGRNRALAVLEDQLAAAAGGLARIVWVDGEPGVGKTTLVRSLLARNPYHGAWASGDEEEKSLAYGLLATMHRAIAVAGSSGAGEHIPSAGTDPMAAGAELLVSLGALDDPLVLVIDDLQWADTLSASALRFALRRLLAEPLLVVLITRPNAVAALGEGWERLLLDGERVSRVHLDGLTTQGMLDLLEATGHGDLGRSVAERLREHTGGNPLHARAMIEELGDSGLQAGGVLPAPRSFALLTIGRLAALDGDAAQLVTAGAVLGMKFSIDLAASIGGVDDPASALDRAVDAGLIEPVGEDQARFAHPLVRGAIYNDMPPEKRRALHQEAASGTEGNRSLEHRVAAASGSDDALAAELERRAIKEWLSGKGSLAYEHFMAASNLSSERAARERRLLIAVEALFSAADYQRAYAMQETVMLCEDSAHRSYVLGMIDKTPAAEHHFSEAAAKADESDISLLRLRALGGRAVVHLRQGRFERALDDANTTMASGIEGWASGLMRWVQVVSLANLGRTQEAWQVLDRVPESRQAPFELDLLCARGLLDMAEDDLPSAVTDLTALAERARAGETCRLLEFALSMLAAAQYRLGGWDESAMNSELAIALYGDAQVPIAHCVRALVHAGRGRFDLAGADIRSAQEADRAIPTAGGPYYLAIARAGLAQARGQVRELREATAPLLDGRIQPTVEGLDPWGWRVLAIEGLLADGELGAARERMAELVDVVEGGGWESARTDMARLAGRLAEDSHDRDAALASYEAGARPTNGRPPLPLSAARLALSHGSLLRRAGNRRAAIERLRTARNQFAALGAAPFMAMCDGELAASGLVLPAATESGALQLTPAEQTVAHLVSQGLTNREAATRLYVSPKTIDYHLGNIYAKLGISSRRDLADRVRLPD